MNDFLTAMYNIHTKDVEAYHLINPTITKEKRGLKDRDGWRQMVYFTNGNITCLLKHSDHDNLNAKDLQVYYKQKFPTIEDLMKHCIEKGADVNATNSYGMPTIWGAIVNEDIIAVDLLLKYGADIHTVDVWKENIFHKIVLYWSDVIFNRKLKIQRLIERGADVNAINYRGDTPLDIALRMKNKEIIEILKQLGGKRAVDLRG